MNIAETCCCGNTQPFLTKLEKLILIFSKFIGSKSEFQKCSAVFFFLGKAYSLLNNTHTYMHTYTHHHVLLASISLPLSLSLSLTIRLCHPQLPAGILDYILYA